MAKAKRGIYEQSNDSYSYAPADLHDHIFFGLTLDEDQKKFRDAIWSKDKLIIFCDSCAGTGKTLIATACAELLCKYKRYKGIVYVAAPVQEKKQGYIAGSIEEKSDPYFGPFYDAMKKLDIPRNTLSSDINNQKEGTAYIECVTHTFLRGLNLEDMVVIIDESQNYYQDELLKVLTRIHDTCKVIVIGHRDQCDLYDNPSHSGFVNYLEWYKDDPRTEVCKLTINHRGWISSHADALRLPYTRNDNKGE